MTTFADAIRTARQERRLRLHEVAAAIGKSAQYVNDIEKGRRNTPPVGLIRPLATALGIHPDVLFYYAGRVPDDLPRDVEPARIVRAYAAMRRVLLSAVGGQGGAGEASESHI